MLAPKRELHSATHASHLEITKCRWGIIWPRVQNGYSRKKDHHCHHTVQATILHPPHACTYSHHHRLSPQHNYVTMHAFSICATALGKRPPASPSHSASYNITSNHHYHHRHHHDHHSTNYNACIQYMRHCFRKKTTTTAITQCKLQCMSNHCRHCHHSTSYNACIHCMHHCSRK